MASGRIDTRAVGLEAGCALAKWLTGKEHMHYGLWAGLDPVAANLGAAQEAYSQRLFALLPEGRLRILDIGGGAGETAKRLIAMGHSVEIVVPSAFLAARCRVNAPEAVVHEAMFEEARVTGPFDLCLFSESFQYIPLTESLPRAKALLAPGGAIVIGDCFRRLDGDWLKNPHRTVGGGHVVEKFQEAAAREGLVIEAEEDVTDQVAPSIDVEQAFFNVLGVGVAGMDRELRAKRPWLRGLVVGVLGRVMGARRRASLMRRLTGDERTGEAFRRSNRYLLMRLRPASV
ncbi:class I SAM-dependent methyltransferase [Rhodobacter sp. HX-7-19]|uniref:Class I SAM-dependent methyltransferase n=1 Tax=Paragemmobacter kunshanensis TaxID=2583234 RepID=A0A6M1TRC0_9RHOB|nr:class I SAM-dependent methyltransferase [Rhodobacter kunshanensis]NGQ90417.1 class I SAM-dependent methyltransferase [Rhodobacter kunshanensis]